MRILLLLFATTLVLSTAPAQDGPAEPAKLYAAQVRPFLEAHCQECHRGEKPKGEFRLDQLDPAFVAKTAEERWEKVLEQLKAGSMPPKKKPRPPEAQTKAVT